MRYTKSLSLGIAALLIIGTATTWFLLDKQQTTPTTTAWDTPRSTQSDRTRSEKSKRMHQAGYPDLFADYHAGIRTGEEGASYPPNYKLVELEKARAASKGAGVQQTPWVERGPGNVSGRTRALIVDPGDPFHQTWFAGSVGGGIWKTSNAGDTWTNLTPNLPNLAIASLAMAPSNPNVIYAGTGEGFYNTDAVAGAGIFKSTNRGLSWEQLPSTATEPEFRFNNRLIVDPANADIVVAATNEGLYRTDDGGATWAEVYATNSRVQQVVHIPDDFNVQLGAVNGQGVVKSTDGGQTWSEIASTFNEGFGRLELAVAPSRPSWVYAAIAAAGGQTELYLSTDAGNSWTPVAESDPANDPDWLGAQGWYDNAIAVHPFDHETIYVGGIGMWKVTLSADTQEISDFTSFQQNDTESFLDFVSFDDANLFEVIATGPGTDIGATNITEDDFVSVEVRFGPGRAQMAHRYIPADSAGIPLNTYPYAGYSEVPFEVWDITNNRQLMVSFRDRLNDGIFELIERDDDNLGREYIFIHDIDYDPNAPDASVGVNGGLVHKLLYFFWPMLAAGGEWDVDNLPESNLRLTHDTFLARLRVTEPMTVTVLNDPNDGTVHVDHHNLTMIPVDEANNQFKILNGNDGGVYFSQNNGLTWKATENGYNTSQFYGADKKPGFNVFAGGMQDNGTWRSFNTDFSVNWQRALGGDGFDVIWNQTDDKKIVGSIQFNAIQFSTDGGVNWVDGTNGLTDVGSGSGQFITSLDNHPDTPDVLFTIGRRGVWRSDDWAASWNLTQIPSEDWAFGGAGKVRVSLANPDVVWAAYEMDGFSSSGSDQLGKLHLSTDRGDTFTAIETPEISPDGDISGLATHPTDDQTVFALFSITDRAKVLRSTDRGQTWEDLSAFSNGESTNGFPDVAVYDLLVMPDNPDEIWVGTEIGLFYSLDDGASWLHSPAIPAVSIWRMRIRDDQVVAATHGRGVWSVTLADRFTADEDATNAELPKQFTLHQNYPNPFNPTTTIAFDVPKQGRVKLAVYDVAGRQVAVLADQDFTPGTHQIAWDAREMASGVYLYRLEAGDVVRAHRMTLVK